MLTNRSVPTNTLLPHMEYKDVAAAVAWLSNAFGFTEHYRYGVDDGRVAGAQIHLGDAWIMLSSQREEGAATSGRSATPLLTVFVEDVDEHFAHSVAAGARITEDLHETIYGERQYAAEDPAGNRWLFSTHVRDVSPEEWGATVAVSN